MLNFYGREFSSRLLIGSALYPSPRIMQEAIRASGSKIVTVSIRRESAGGKTGDQFWSLIRELDVTVLPNTAACKSVREAVATARLARELFGTSWVKLEVIADDETLQSAGFIRSGVETRILGADGAALARGETGEIAVRGDVVMRGYWRNEAANVSSLADGWLKTGDIGHFDARGRLHILDRRHDTIISGGSNIYPREVEDVLTRHPAVREAIVFGLPDAEWGESVAAAVVTNDESLNAETLIAFCLEHLASFKKPKRIELLAELPKNAYGKVLRRDLRERFGKG